MPKTKKILRLARPKTGRKMFPHTVSLTLEQIKWLRQFPNSSGMLRKLIDNIRELQGDVEPKLSLLAMMREIEILTEQVKKVETEKASFLWDNFDWKYQKDGIEYVPVLDKRYMEGSEEWVFKKADAEESAFIQKQMKAYDVALESLKIKLKELKERFMKINLINK